MAVPFRRVSSTRRNKRRTHDKLSAPTLVYVQNVENTKCLIEFVNIVELTKV